MEKRKTTIEFIKSLFSGKISKAFLIKSLIPIIYCILIVTYFIANLLYHGVYDWRYMVISGLNGKATNPAGFIFTSIGMATTAILLIPMIGYHYRRFSKIWKGPTITAMVFLIITIIGMIFVGMIGQFLDVIDELHGPIAVLTFLCCWLFSLFLSFPILKDRLKGKQQFNFKVALFAAAIILIPLLGLVGSQAYIATSGVSWDWDSSWLIEQGISPIFSLGFWEWLLFFAQYIYFLLLAILVPENVETLKKKD